MSADAPVRVPSGRAMRRWTRRFERHRSSTSVSDLLGDVYTVILTLAVTGAIVAGVAARLGADVAGREPVTQAHLDVRWVSVLAAVAALAAVAGLLGRLGPVSLGSAESGWWLPLPGDRRSLLTPAALRWPGFAGATGALGGLLLALALAPSPTVLLVAVTGVLGAGVGVALGAVLGLAQARRRGRRLMMRASDTLLALVPVGALVLGLVPTAPPRLLGAPVVSAAVVAVLAGMAVVVMLRRLPDLRDAELRERGAVTGQLRGAALSMDTRELGRALSQEATPAQRSRSARLRWLRGARRRPGLALVTADALLLARSTRHVVQLAVGACLPLAALLVAAPAPSALLAALLVGAWVAALGTAEGARWAEMAPVVDAILPLSARAVRWWRLAVPTATMVLWSLAVFAAVAWRYGDAGPWLALAVLSAPVWAAGVHRSAYRAAPDWSGPLVITPMGAFPPGMSSFALKGPDVAILGAAPVAVALLVGTAPPLLLAVQAVLTAVVLAVAAHVPKPPARAGETGPRPGADA
ncbi:DUF6297 family protein [Georgenia faecalis]|uniref:DUF6297 family protein n=1 Tax=Georgenia faecalis TaxID=2483799 RepID=A0ABV9DCS4_9MICO|nr:DUF6297 family protein [Georgenia faecalis]